MNKYISFLTIGFISIFFSSFANSAVYVDPAIGSEKPVASDSMIMPPYDDFDIPQFFGQDHYYSVNFRGNGLATVFMRVAFYNNGSTPLKELSFRFPSNIQPEAVVSYQIIRDLVCDKYDYNTYDQASGQYRCLGYSKPDYYDYYYGQNTYKKAQVTLASDTINISIPQGVSSGETGSVLLYFRTYGYAKKDVFGAYNYNFKTLMVDDTIRNLKVGVTADTGLVLKGGNYGVDYFRDSAPILESAKSVSFGGSFKNSVIDTSISNIGYGSINKNAQNLMPLDSFDMSGSFATNKIKLYAKETLIGFIAVVVVLVGFVLLTIKVLRGLKNNPYDSSQKPMSKSGLSIMLSMLSGFISSFLGSLYIFLTYLGLSSLSDWSYSMGFKPVMYFLLLILILGLGILIMLPIHILVGVKRGLWWGFVSFGFMLMWFFVAFLVLALLSAAGVDAGSNPQPYYPTFID